MKEWTLDDESLIPNAKCQRGMSAPGVSDEDQRAFAVMMLGTAKARLELAMLDIQSRDGRWRLRAMRQIEAACNEASGIADRIPMLKGRPRGTEGR